MRLLKGIGIFFLAAFVIIQFFKPDKNVSKKVSTDAITSLLMVPQNVKVVLQNACYDCHSNNTRYPWYVSVQPVAWFMANHINEAKDKLNFDLFGTYSHRRQLSKLKSIAGSVKDESMPLFSYTLMHRDARLSSTEKSLLIDWALKTKDSLEAAK